MKYMFVSTCCALMSNKNPYLFMCIHENPCAAAPQTHAYNIETLVNIYLHHLVTNADPLIVYIQR